MGKRKWDGSFENAKYTETGNYVNNVIENNGRLVHEPTVDGYTHEVVDRGKYISDDYYFPQREKGKKSHIHYEIRSNGEVLIDGKSIKKKKEGERMVTIHGRGLSRNKEMSGTIFAETVESKITESQKIIELGEKFVYDKNRIEDAIEKTENSRLPNDEKRKFINQLETLLVQVEENYDREVTEEAEKIHEEIKKQIESISNAIEELEKQTDLLLEVQSDVEIVDVAKVAEVAEIQKYSYEMMKKEYEEKYKVQMQQAELQKNKILSRRSNNGGV